MTSNPTVRLALFGAAPDTPNMGVSALFHSAIAGIAKHLGSVEFVVFDNGWGRRDTTLDFADTSIKLIRFGARGGRRYYRQENLATMHFASRLGPLGAKLNEGIRLIDSCDAVLDVSGGDSFSDIYGRERFNNIWRPKAIAINRSKPLILLPQTYGPHKEQAVRKLAVSALLQTHMAWARDHDSFLALKELLGDRFDPARHLCGVDMAFGLRPSDARHILDPLLTAWLNDRGGAGPLVGFNVSGLIYNDAAGARARYGFRADYRKTVIGFLAALIKRSTARVVLISHVMDQPGHYESDLAACSDVMSRLGKIASGRVQVAPATLDQSQVKWLISKMDWFCGTRMHSTIAALSSGVPTAAISYSDKTKGVFDTCGQGEHVLDPRRLETLPMIEGLLHAFDSRQRAKEVLNEHLPAVIAQADEQAALIARSISSAALACTANDELAR